MPQKTGSSKFGRNVNISKDGLLMLGGVRDKTDAFII